MAHEGQRGSFAGTERGFPCLGALGVSSWGPGPPPVPASGAPWCVRAAPPGGQTSSLFCAPRSLSSCPFRGTGNPGLWSPASPPNTGDPLVCVPCPAVPERRVVSRVSRQAVAHARLVPPAAPRVTSAHVPRPAGKITLRDLKKCKLANVFFDTFFNIEKYLDHEQKEQVSLLRVSVAGGAGRRPPLHRVTRVCRLGERERRPRAVRLGEVRRRGVRHPGGRGGRGGAVGGRVSVRPTPGGLGPETGAGAGAAPLLRTARDTA